MRVKLKFFENKIVVFSKNEHIINRIKYVFKYFIDEFKSPDIYFRIEPKDKSKNYELISSNEKFCIEYSYDNENYNLWDYNDTFLPPVRINPFKNRFLVLHGCAVCYEGKTIAFFAPSMAGKTSLLVYLISNGFKAVTDDLLFIDIKDNFYIWPYKKPVGIRETSLKIIDGLEDKVSKCLCENVITFQNIEGFKTWLVHLEELFKFDVYTKNKLKIDYFIQIDNKSSNKFYQLKNNEVYKYLINSICNSGIDSKDITETLLNLIVNTKTYYISTKNLEFTMKKIKNLINEE